MDRFQALRVFVRVADLGSFTRAADALELSRARVSEAVADLERELGARLVHRTTRRVSLSDDGRAYYERARQILADLEEADALVLRSGASARGRLRIAMPIGLARQFVVPALPRLLSQNPELALEVRLENRAVDLVEEGVDCAISYGQPANDALIARRVAATHLLTCASPAYLARHGAPKSPDDLVHHSCIAFLTLATLRPAAWLFRARGQSITLAPSGSLAFNSMEACVEAAEAGLGVTQVLSALAHRAIERKQLRRVLAAYAADGPALYLVYPPNRQLSARIRVVLAFLNDVLESAGRL
jgi:LysR family transcriptional regulator, regulator for bpeEF and oprC